MAGRESVQFDFLSRGAGPLAEDFKKTGEGATLAAKGARLLADSLDKQRRATDVSAGATLAMAKADKILADAEGVLSGRAIEAELALKRQQAATKDTAGESVGLAARLSALTGGAGGGGGAMGALIGAGIGLAPILTTVGIGLAADAAAAAGVIGPVVKAAESAKGLQGAWAKLDPAQRAAAESLLTLKGDYHAFQNTLKPEILTAFAGATRLAGNVLHSVQPVATATGKAFGGFIGQIDATLQNSQWQQFWSFMGATAPGDMRLLGDTVVSLTNDLPPLLESLQPVGRSLLVIADDTAKATGGVTRFYQSFQQRVPVSTEHTFGFIRDLDKWTTELTNKVPGLVHVNNVISGVQRGVSGSGSAAATAAARMKPLAPEMMDAARSAQAEATQQMALNTALANGLGPLQKYIGATITQASDAHALEKALKASGDRIGYNTTKQRDSFSAAQTYIQDLQNTGAAAVGSHKGIDAQIRSIQNALPLLEHVKGKTADYRDELAKLKDILDRLRAEKNIRETVIVSGTGSWTMHNPANQSLPGGFPGGTGAASGMLVRGGIPGRDSVLVNTMPGELIVPTPMVQAGAVDHLRGRIPGFAQGGIVGSYSGSPGGLGPWAASDWNASIRSVTESIGNTMAKSFSSLFAGLGAGASGPLQRIARQMLGQLGWGSQWPEFNALEMREAGWRVDATNPTSGAYGLPQALPPGKMASAGADWRTNPVTQLRWMMGYIGGRYGSPAGAWAHEVSAGWYDQGGYLPPGLSIAMNGTGRPEPVGAAVGSTYNITVKVPVSASPRETGRAIVDAIKKFEAGSGTGWRK